MALSCTRSWGCVCGEVPGDPHSCPFHAAAEQKRVLRQIFGGRVDEEGFPLSPTPSETAVGKERMVDWIQKAAGAAGAPLRGPEGQRLIAGHAFRISGCRHLHRRGVQAPPLMCMARWDSMCVLNYLKNAPLNTSLGST